jgi:ribosomal RNA-processing protein 9
LNFADASHVFFRADTQSTTSVAVHHPHLYTVSKDRTLIKWELITPKKTLYIQNSPINQKNHKVIPPRKKPKQIKFVKSSHKKKEGSDRQGHTGTILTVAVSPSGKYVATGGSDRKLIIWDAETLIPMKTFTHHRDSVSGLAFTQHISQRSSGEQLFSASFDRTIKTWSLSSSGHAYVETLFGHQDTVTSLASMMTDQCVSVGARDRTARLWKVVDEAQLVFRGDSSKKAEYQNTNLDCVAVIPPNHFVTGSDAGEISLWSIHKKKPLFTVPTAHGLDPIPPLEELSPEVDLDTAAKNAKYLRRTPRWITALTTVPGTDIVLSGSWDGWIRAWRVSEDKRMIHPLGPIGGGPQQPSGLTATPSSQLKQTLTFDGVTSSNAMVVDAFGNQQQYPQSTSLTDPTKDTILPLIKGVVNDIAVFERRPESSKQGVYTASAKTNSASAKADGPSSTGVRGLCIVAAMGKEHRFGRLKCFANNFYDGTSAQGRNGAVVFEVDFLDESGEEEE